MATCFLSSDHIKRGEKKKTPLGIKFKNEERSRRVNSSRVFRLRGRAPEQRGVGARHELRVVSFDFLCRRSDFKEWPKTNQQPASLTCDGRSFKSTVRAGKTRRLNDSKNLALFFTCRVNAAKIR